MAATTMHPAYIATRHYIGGDQASGYISVGLKIQFGIWGGGGGGGELFHAGTDFLTVCMELSGAILNPILASCSEVE